MVETKAPLFQNLVKQFLFGYDQKIIYHNSQFLQSKKERNVIVGLYLLFKSHKRKVFGGEKITNRGITIK